jgi:hypothetical protein
MIGVRLFFDEARVKSCGVNAMRTITAEQKQAVEEAGDSPVELEDPQTGAAYVLMRADVFRELRKLLEKDEDVREQEAWSKVARKARDEWARENPY